MDFKLLPLRTPIPCVTIEDNSIGTYTCGQGLEGGPKRAVGLSRNALAIDDGGNAVESRGYGNEREGEEKYQVKLSVFETACQPWMAVEGGGGFSRPGPHAGVDDGRYGKEDEKKVGDNI